MLCLIYGAGLVAQSCPTLVNPMDCSLPDSFVPGILQARILECVAISFLPFCSAAKRLSYTHIFFSYSFPL